MPAILSTAAVLYPLRTAEAFGDGVSFGIYDGNNWASSQC